MGLCDIMETPQGSPTDNQLATGLDVLVLEQASSCAPSLELSHPLTLDYYTKGQQAEEETAAQMLAVAVREDGKTWC